MKITLIEPQKKSASRRTKRFNIFLDGQFAFGADEDTIVEQRLIVGKEIPPENLEKLLFEVEVGKLVEKVYGQLNVRLRSEKEIRDYLRRLAFKRKLKDQDEISDVVIESLIQKLKSKDLINDTRFATAWIEARRKSKNKGLQALKAELYQKGINREIIDEKLSEFDSDSEELLAKQALEKKMRSWIHLPELEFKQKALQFLIRRGFDYALSKEVVEKTSKEEV